MNSQRLYYGYWYFFTGWHKAGGDLLR